MNSNLTINNNKIPRINLIFLRKKYKLMKIKNKLIFNTHNYKMIYTKFKNNKMNKVLKISTNSNNKIIKLHKKLNNRVKILPHNNNNKMGKKTIILYNNKINSKL